MKKVEELKIIIIREMYNCEVDKATMYIIDKKLALNRLNILGLLNYHRPLEKDKNPNAIGKLMEDTSFIIMYEAQGILSLFDKDGKELAQYDNLDLYYGVFDCAITFRGKNVCLNPENWNHILIENMSDKHISDEIGIKDGFIEASNKEKRNIKVKKIPKGQFVERILHKSSFISGYLVDIVNDIANIILWDEHYVIGVEYRNEHILAFSLSKELYNRLREALR